MSAARNQRRLLGRRLTSRKADAIGVHAGDLLEVVGESYRQGALRRVAELATDSSPYLDDLTGRARKIAEGEPPRASSARSPQRGLPPRAKTSPPQRPSRIWIKVRQ